MTTPEDLIGDRAAAAAATLASQYGGCAQTVFAALQDVFEVGPEADGVFRAAQGLSGGIGEGDGACGAYAGAALMISYLTGQDRAEYAMKPNPKADGMLHTLHEQFTGRYGSVVCQDLHRRLFGKAYDFHDPVEMAQFMGKADACVGVMAEAARMAAEVIEDNAS